MLLYQKERQSEQAAPSAPAVSFGGAHSKPPLPPSLAFFSEGETIQMSYAKIVALAASAARLCR